MSDTQPTRPAGAPAPLPARETTLKEQRRPILIRYARLSKQRRPVMCSKFGSDGKSWVIYDTAAAASEAAIELRRLDGITRYPNPCPASHRGHQHLTSRPPTATP